MEGHGGMTEKTIKWLTDRVETIIPDQLEQAKRTLGRVTLKFYGQQQLFNPDQMASIQYYRTGEEDGAN